MKPSIHDKQFEEAAHRMIGEKRHAPYMRQALKEYQAYQEFFSRALLEEPTKEIFIIRAKYRFQKNLWREIEISGTNSLADLATCIIDSMGWIEDHLHGFWFPDMRRNRFYGDLGIFHEEMEDDPFTKLKTKRVAVSQIDWKKYPMLGFVFDFGDGHEFDISVKSVRPTQKTDKQHDLPRLIDQRGIAPEQYPEEESEDGDVLKAKKDPKADSSAKLKKERLS